MLYIYIYLCCSWLCHFNLSKAKSCHPGGTTYSNKYPSLSSLGKLVIEVPSSSVCPSGRFYTAGRPCGGLELSCRLWTCHHQELQPNPCQGQGSKFDVFHPIKAASTNIIPRALVSGIKRNYWSGIGRLEQIGQESASLRNSIDWTLFKLTQPS